MTVKDLSRLIKSTQVMSIVVITLLVAVFVGCRSSEMTDSFETPANYDSISEMQEFAYIAEFVTLPTDVGSVKDLVVSLTDVTFVSATYEYIKYRVDNYQFDVIDVQNKIYSMSIDGSNITKLNRYAPFVTSPPGAHGDYFIEAIHVDSNGNVWIFESWKYIRYNLPPDFNDIVSQIWELWEYSEIAEEGCVIRKLDPTGKELLSIDVSLIREQYDYIEVNAFYTDVFQNIYLCVGSFETAGKHIFLIDGVDNSIHNIDTDLWTNQFLQMPDGSVAIPVMVVGEEGNTSQALQIIDFTAKVLGDTIYIPADVSQDTFNGSGDYDFYIADYQSLYGYILGEDEPIELLKWNNVNVAYDRSRDISGFIMAEDGQLFCVRTIKSPYRSFQTSYHYELMILTKMPRSEIPEKTVLTIGTVGLTVDLRDLVDDFNRKNHYYRIEIIDYSEYNTDNSSKGAFEKLSFDITTGATPDIFDVTFMPYRTYATAGLFADLYQFIDSDPDYNRNDFVEGVFKAAEIDGCLYQVFPTFGIYTILGRPDILGSDIGWNIDEFMAVLSEYPEADIPLGAAKTNESILYDGIAVGLSDYINWETGTVSFDSAEFLQLLEFANTFPAIDNVSNNITDDDAVLDGRMIMSSHTVWSFNHFPYLKSRFGGDIILKGFPTAGRNGNSIDIYDGLAIAQNSEHKEAAWSFVRTLLDADIQLPNGRFPTNIAAFNRKAADEIEDSYFYDENSPLIPFVENDLEQIISLLGQSPIVIYNYIDYDIWHIVNEESDAYFRGTCTAEDAAKIIQSRVSLMVSERR